MVWRRRLMLRLPELGQEGILHSDNANRSKFSALRNTIPIAYVAHLKRMKPCLVPNSKAHGM